MVQLMHKLKKYMLNKKNFSFLEKPAEAILAIVFLLVLPALSLAWVASNNESLNTELKSISSTSSTTTEIKTEQTTSSTTDSLVIDNTTPTTTDTEQAMSTTTSLIKEGGSETSEQTNQKESDSTASDNDTTQDEALRTTTDTEEDDDNKEREDEEDEEGESREKDEEEEDEEKENKEEEEGENKSSDAKTTKEALLAPTETITNAEKATSTNNSAPKTIKSPKPEEKTDTKYKSAKKPQQTKNIICLEKEIKDEDACRTFFQENKKEEVKSVMIEQKISPECRLAGITDLSKCELYVLKINMPEECRLAGITTKDGCSRLIEQNYKRPQKCDSLNENECGKLMDELILARIDEQKLIKSVQDKISPIINNHIEIKDSPSGTSFISRDEKRQIKAIEAPEIKALEAALPFNKSERVSFIILPTATSTQIAAPALIVLDSDFDGLPDEMEARLGTDPNNKDSDNDGYEDGLEVRTGHNPLGADKKELSLSGVEKAIVNKVALEQPDMSGPEKITESLSIKEVITERRDDKEALKLSGKALPGEIVTLYIYSAMPIIITVKADASGNWVYTLDKTLVDGGHEAYVVINDENGKIVEKSAAFSFFVKEAQAVTIDDYLRADVNLGADTPETMTNWFIAGGIGLIIFAIAIYIIYSRRRSNP